jgi:hypothetical protein
VVSWYRHLNSDPSTGNVLIRDSLHQASLKVLELAFQFARAEAALTAESAPPTPAAPGNLQQFAVQAAARISSIQSRISVIDTQLPKAAQRQRQTLVAERNELNAELDLAKEIQTTIQNVATFAGAIESGSEALETQIAELESSVPEAAAGKNPAPANPPSKESSAVFAPESAGVAGLTAELFSIHASRARINGPGAIATLPRRETSRLGMIHVDSLWLATKHTPARRCHHVRMPRFHVDL